MSRLSVLIARFTYIGILLFVGGPALAAQTEGHADAEVVGNLGVAEVEGLSFGQFSVGNTNGMIIVNQGGTIFTGGVDGLTDGNRGEFDVVGTENALYNISVPALIALASGDDEMTAQIFVTPPVQHLAADGTDNFFVNGTLTVGANQPSGLYTATYDVSVEYQ